MRLRRALTSLGTIRRSRAFRIVSAAAAVALAIDALAIEPYNLEVTRHHRRARLAAPIKIAHLSDLHMHGTGRRELAVLAALAAARPDLIAITGDTTDEGTLEVARDFFVRLRDPGSMGGWTGPPLGTWAVRGNWENWRQVRDERAFHASVGVRFLENEGALARPDVFVAGLDDAMSGHADLGLALRDAPAAAFKLALFHSPVSLDGARGRFDLALAGHTHGGQVRVPWIGAPWLPPGSGRYVAGWYADGDATMYVSRGIGTSLLPVRFACRPELAIVSLD